jgi:Fe2+ or Zn2+ uptake regulation protein
MKLVEGRIVGDDQSREEYRFRSLREHYTLTCKRCGKIVPVEPDIVDAFRREAAALGVTVLGAHSCFIGYCEDCTAALAAEEAASTAAHC